MVKAKTESPAASSRTPSEGALLYYLLPLLAITAYVVGWSLNPDNYFYADDWAHLNNAAFQPIVFWTKVFPVQVYNDRPIGSLLIRGLYHLIGLNHVAYHAIFVALHLLNVALGFLIARRLLRSNRMAFCAALLFGCWSSSIDAVTWVAAVFDLVCCTLVLAAILTHLARKSPWLVAALLAVAIRSKEIAIVLPALLLADEALVSLRFNRARWIDVARRYAPMLAVSGIFAACYLRLYLGAPVPESHPYHLTLGPGTFFQGMNFYLGALTNFPAAGAAMAAVFLAALLVFTALRWRAESFGWLGFTLFLLPVLFLASHRAPLYLYLPALFFWIGLMGLAHRALESIPRVSEAAAGALLIALTLAAVVIQYRTFYLPKVAWSLHTFAIFRSNIAQVERIAPSLAPDTAIFISGLPVYLNVFDFGPCYSVRLVYREPRVTCVIDKSAEETRRLFAAQTGPKLLLSYSEGVISAGNPK